MIFYGVWFVLTLKDIADSGLFLELSGSTEVGCLDHVRLTDLSNESNSYQVKILGVLSDQHLLVSYPTTPQGVATVRKNQVFKARRFDGCSFYEFTSEVVEMSFGPVAYLVVTVPVDSRASVKVLRDSVRKPSNLPVTLSSPGCLVHGICANISNSGALVVGLSTPEFKEGVMTIALPVTGRKVVANIPIDVMRQEVRYLYEHPVYACGLRFGQKSDLAFLALRAFLQP